MPVRPADIDDAALPARDHVGSAYPGDVDQDVDAARGAGDRCGNRTFDVGGARDVGRLRRAAPAQPLDLRSERREGGIIPPEQGEVGPFGRELAGDRRANALAGSGQKSSLST